MKPFLLSALGSIILCSSLTEAAPMYSYPGTLARTNLVAGEFEKMIDETGRLNPQISKKLFASYMRNSFQRSTVAKPVKADTKVLIHFDSAPLLDESRYGVMEIRSSESPSIPVGFGIDVKVKIIVNEKDPSMLWVAPESGEFTPGKNYLLYFTDGKSALYHTEFQISN